MEYSKLVLKSALKIDQFKKNDPISYTNIIAIIVMIVFTHEENRFFTAQLKYLFLEKFHLFLILNLLQLIP